MTIEMVMKELAVLKDLFPLLPESNTLFEEWERLVITYGVSGKTTHDARLVAVMKLNGIGKILTFNVQDFTRYKTLKQSIRRIFFDVVRRDVLRAPAFRTQITIRSSEISSCRRTFVSIRYPLTRFQPNGDSPSRAPDRDWLPAVANA